MTIHRIGAGTGQFMRRTGGIRKEGGDAIGSAKGKFVDDRDLRRRFRLARIPAGQPLFELARAGDMDALVDDQESAVTARLGSASGACTGAVPSRLTFTGDYRVEVHPLKLFGYSCRNLAMTLSNSGVAGISSGIGAGSRASGCCING
jgi:hypothetical protein